MLILESDICNASFLKSRLGTPYDSPGGSVGRRRAKEARTASLLFSKTDGFLHATALGFYGRKIRRAELF